MTEWSSFVVVELLKSQFLMTIFMLSSFESLSLCLNYELLVFIVVCRVADCGMPCGCFVIASRF